MIEKKQCKLLEYLTINEMYEDYDDTGSDDDFQRTYCHIKDEEE